jgi:hypothetical protein
MRDSEGAARRRLLKGLAAGAPFVFTVASRPVQGAFCTPSAWVSGNLSDHAVKLLSCGGNGPQYWMTNHDNRWASTGFSAGTCLKTSKLGLCEKYKKDGTPFHASSIHGGGVFPGAKYGDKTLMQVLLMDPGADPYRIGGHMVAALLSASSSSSYGMTVAQVVDMYGQLEFQGFYQPSSGPPMFTPDVVLFLKNTYA